MFMYYICVSDLLYSVYQKSSPLKTIAKTYAKHFIEPYFIWHSHPLHLIWSESDQALICAGFQALPDQSLNRREVWAVSRPHTFGQEVLTLSLLPPIIVATRFILMKKTLDMF